MTVAMMVDWETLDSKPTAAVRSVGWAIFCYDTKQILSTGYIDGINVDAQFKRGRTISWATLCWWMAQGEEARKAMFTEGFKEGFQGVVMALGAEFQGHECTEIWGNGTDFDTQITAGLLDLANLQPFWNFRKQRCYREFMIGKAKIHKPEISHHAMHDAIAQAKNVLEYI